MFLGLFIHLKLGFSVQDRSVLGGGLGVMMSVLELEDPNLLKRV